jgi:hypothetical protein
MQSAWPIGWGMAALIATLLFTVFAQELAWRVIRTSHSLDATRT